MIDYLAIFVSILALAISFACAIISYMSFKRNDTKLDVMQMDFYPNAFASSLPNKLYLDREQSQEMWQIAPVLHLFLYVKISNESYTGITISNIIINDAFTIAKINSKCEDDEIPITFFASEKRHEIELENYNTAIPMLAGIWYKKDFDFINIGERIEAKSSIEGIIYASGNQPLYNSIRDGLNKITIVTPGKNMNTTVDIAKTLIPNSNSVIE